MDYYDINYIKGDKLLLITQNKSNRIDDNIYDIIEISNDHIIIEIDKKIFKININEEGHILKNQESFSIIELENIKLLNNDQVMDWVIDKPEIDDPEMEIESEILTDKRYNINDKKEDFLSDLINL